MSEQGYIHELNQREEISKAMTAKTHELKCWPEYFREVFLGHKTFEIRKNDRDFQIGDTIILNEYEPFTKQYSGDKIARRVTYILEGGEFGIEKGYVVMAIS